MTPDNIKKVVEEAFSQKKAIRIEGYESTSGSVCNYTVSQLPAGGYKKLVEESLTQLQELKVTNDGSFEDAVFNEALSEKITSFEKTLSGEHAQRNFNETLDTHKYYATSESNPGAVVILNLKVIETQNLKPKTKVVNSKPKTLAKNAIEKQLPVSSYIGRMNLHPDRLKSITIVY